jgi:hypothetical protein
MRFAQNCFSLRLDHFGKEDLCISYLDHPWRLLLLLQSFNSGITLLLPANRRDGNGSFHDAPQLRVLSAFGVGGLELGGQVEAWPLLLLRRWRDGDCELYQIMKKI